MAAGHCDRCDRDASRVDLAPFPFMGGTGMRHKKPCDLAASVIALGEIYDLTTGKKKEEIPAPPPGALTEEDLHLFVMQRTEIDELEARLKEVKAQNKILAETLFDQIHAMNLRSYPHTVLGRFTPTARLYVNLAKPRLNEQGEVEHEDARLEVEEWSKKELDPAGHPLFDDLFYWAIKSPRLKAVVKQRIEDNVDPPPGVEIGYQKDITFTPPK